jgi:hypothetical protein
MLAGRSTRWHTRYFRQIMNDQAHEIDIISEESLMPERDVLWAKHDGLTPALAAEMLAFAGKMEMERDNALADFRQADTDSIRALHERNEARGQRDLLAEALQEMRYGHTDKAEKMAVAALSYLTK